MTVLSDAALRSAIVTAINDNTSGDVTPADVRNLLIDFLDSITVISRFLTRSVLVGETIVASVKSIHTDGFAALGDGGHGSYSRMSVAPIYPSNPAYVRTLDRYKADGTTDATHGGYWQLVAEDGKIDIHQMGGKCDGVTDDHAAWVAAEEYWRRINQNSIEPEIRLWGGGETHFSGTTYVGSTFEMQTVNMSIIGASGGGTEGNHSIWAVPANTTAIIIHGINTTGAEDEDTPGQGGSQGARLENFAIFSAAAGDPTGTGHGIHMRGRAALRNLYIRGFSEDGVHIVATAGGDLDGNANNWTADRLAIDFCGRHGFYTSGADVNAGIGICLNVNHCGGFGIYDDSFLGNTYIGCHTATCGVMGPLETPNTVTSWVTYGGNAYSVIVGQETAASTTTPGTNENVWALSQTGLGAHSTRPAWVSGTTYRSGGSYYAKQGNARNVFLGCYSEGDHGVLQSSPPSIFVGGLLAAGSSSVDRAAVIAGRLNGGFNLTDQAMVQGYRTTSGGSSDLELWQTWIGDTAPGETTVDILGHTDPDYFPAGFRIKRDTNNILFDYGDSNTWMFVSGPNTVRTFGRSGTVPHAMVTDRLWLGPFNDDCRNITFNSAPPTTGAHAKGDLVINNDPSASGIFAWQCTTAGTPGTWTIIAMVVKQTSAYTTSNVSADRTYDANATTTDELADVLGTLIADLKLAGILT